MEADGKESTAEEPVVIKEHVFVISDDPVQDFDSVHHAQSLIAKYLTEDLKVTVEKMHEFTVQLSISPGTALGTFLAVLQILAFQSSAITFKHHMQKVSKMLQALM